MKKIYKLLLVLILFTFISCFQNNGEKDKVISMQDPEYLTQCRNDSVINFRDGYIYIYNNTKLSLDFKLLHIRRGNIIDTIVYTKRDDLNYKVNSFDLRTKDTLQIKYANNKVINIYDFKNDPKIVYKNNVIGCYFLYYKIDNEQLAVQDGADIWINKWNID